MVRPPRMDSHQQHLRRGFSWLGGALIIAKLTDFGTILLVLRLLTKEQVGAASLVVAFGTVIEALDGLGTSTALVQAPSLSRASARFTVLAHRRGGIGGGWRDPARRPLDRLPLRCCRNGSLLSRRGDKAAPGWGCGHSAGDYEPGSAIRAHRNRQCLCDLRRCVDAARFCHRGSGRLGDCDRVCGERSFIPSWERARQTVPTATSNQHGGNLAATALRLAGDAFRPCASR